MKRVALLVIALLAGAARADSVTLMTGKTVPGKVSFDARDTITVTPRESASHDAAPVRADLNDVVSIDIDSAAPQAPACVATLIDGTRIAATNVSSMDERELRLKRPDGGLLSLKPMMVSEIDFAPQNQLPPTAPGFVGAQLTGKDVAEGDVLSISPTTVKIGSVLFGVQEFDIAKSVQAVHFRSPGVSKAAYVVRASDGSTWQAMSLHSENGKVTLDTDYAGRISLAPADLRSIDLGPASADDLTSLAGSPTGSSNPPLRLSLDQPQRIDLGGKYRAVILTFRVPDTYMPLRSARLVVLADDKEVAKSEALTSIDPPLSITRSVGGVKQLTLKLEATGPAQLGIGGEIEQGRLLRIAK